MLDPTIQEALVAFETSRTGRTPFGLAVAVILRGYAAKDDIAYDPLAPTLYGSSKSNAWFEKSIKVNDRARGVVAATSLVLAHEGVHRVINTSSLSEELKCFELQDDYYTEVLTGVTFVSPVSKATLTAQLAPGGFPEATEIKKWRSKDQLIDFILTRGYAEKLFPGWIHANIANWRGLDNRWATTKGHYIRVLGSDIRNGQLILDILFSVKQLSEWNEVMRVAGSLAPARAALRGFSTAPIARPRMLAIQNRWKVDLGAK